MFVKEYKVPIMQDGQVLEILIHNMVAIASQRNLLKVDLNFSHQNKKISKKSNKGATKWWHERNFRETLQEITNNKTSILN